MKEYEMSISDEDLHMLIGGLIAFISAFTILKLAWVSIPSLLLFLVGWGIVRLRRRPLPKQIHETRSFYLAHIKVLRNYQLFQIIFLNIYLVLKYPIDDIVGNALSISLAFNYLALIIISFLEFTGQLTVSDTLRILPKLEAENEEMWKKKRFQLLYGTKFWIWLAVSGVISIGISTIPFISVFSLNDILVIIIQFVFLCAGIALFIYTFKMTINQEPDLPADQLIKAVDYYNEVGLRERSYAILHKYVENKSENISILSKLAVMYTKDSNCDKVLELTQKILEETEEKEIKVPHMISRAYLMRAVCHKSKDAYEQAYKDITSALTYTPDNQTARKMRREIRKIMKGEEIEK